MFDKSDVDLIVAVLGLITTIFTALAGQVVMSRKRLQEKLDIAQTDIAYLLAVEQAHCEKHRELNRASFKTRIRKEVNAQGLAWSGRFTPGRVRAARGSRVLSTTISARLIVLTKVTVHVVVRGAAYLVNSLPRWFDAALITVENGVTKTLISRLTSRRGPDRMYN